MNFLRLYHARRMLSDGTRRVRVPTKTPGALVGVEFEEHRAWIGGTVVVSIKLVLQTSLLFGLVEVGEELRFVNGIPVTSACHAADLIREADSLSLVLLRTDQAANASRSCPRNMISEWQLAVAVIVFVIVIWLSWQSACSRGLVQLNFACSSSRTALEFRQQSLMDSVQKSKDQQHKSKDQQRQHKATLRADSHAPKPRLTTAQRSATALAPAEIMTWRRPNSKLLRMPAFYLHGSGAFDFRSEVSSFIAATTALGVHGVGETLWHHSFDAFLVPALYSHPARTHSVKEAELHVLAIVPSAARFVHNTTELLSQRMDAVADTLISKDSAVSAMWSDARAKVLLIAPSHDLEQQIGQRLAWLLQKRANVRLATCDPQFGEISANAPYASLYRRPLLVPYLVRPSVSRYAREACMAADAFAPQESRSSIVFHGDTGRYDGGARGAVRDIMSFLDSSDMSSSYPIRHNSTALRLQFARTERAMRHGAMCFVPMGDTLTSPRLFEAVASGCVPIIVRPRRQWTLSLPFGSRIAWNAFSYFLAPAKMTLKHRHQQPSRDDLEHWGHRHAEADWVTSQIVEHNDLLLHARRMALAAFCAHMDPQANPKGAADAVLNSIVYDR